MKWMRFSGLVLLVLAFLIGPVRAQDARLAQQALRCSALLHMLAQAVLGGAEQTSRWHRASDAMAEVQRKAWGSAVPPSEARDDMLKQLQTARDRQEPTLIEEVVVCGAWAEGFLGQGDSWQYVPVYPKVIAPAVRSRYTDVARGWLAPR